VGISWYRWFVRPWLFRLSPEPAQRLAETALSIKPLWRAISPRSQASHPSLVTSLAGIPLANPIGLAAGFDKQCQYLDSLGYVGFGYLIGGTVTPDPRPGNDRPRILRYPDRESLINSLGFPSDGLDVVAARLQRLNDRPAPVLVSVAALDEEGFERCHRTLEPLVEAVELNISSPNTQGLRVFLEQERLSLLLEHLNAGRKKPLFVKLPPYTNNEGREQVHALLQACLAAGVSGVTAGNTIPVSEPKLAIGAGGLSGRVIFPDMLRVLGELRQEAGTKFVINACGGIFTGNDAWQALQAGANTVQLYTGMVYKGPGIVKEICRELARLNQTTV
jgi:dihydroorotate dehydrogenase